MKSRREKSISKKFFMQKKGFTLIELLVVIAIISVLAGLIIGGIAIARKKANVAATSTLLRTISMGLTNYYADYQLYPEGDDYGKYNKTDAVQGNAEMARALCEDPTKGGGMSSPYCAIKGYKQLSDGIALPSGAAINKNGEIIDSWRVPLRYRNNNELVGGVWKKKANAIGEDYDIWSLGPDKKGGADLKKVPALDDIYHR